MTLQALRKKRPELFQGVPEDEGEVRAVERLSVDHGDDPDVKEFTRGVATACDDTPHVLIKVPPDPYK